MIKTAETAFELMGEIAREEFFKQPWYMKLFGALPMRQVKNALKERLDYRSFAAAPLIGYDGHLQMVTAKTNKLKALGIRRRECSRQYRRVHKPTPLYSSIAYKRSLERLPSLAYFR